MICQMLLVFMWSSNSLADNGQRYGMCDLYSQNAKQLNELNAYIIPHATG